MTTRSRGCTGSLFIALVLALGLALGGCARGPDPVGLQRDVQQQLDTLFGSRLLEVESINRQGSAPLTKAAAGESRAIVYYNAVLTFTAPYDPSDWSGLSPTSIANALGATDEGVIGLANGRIDKGAQLRAYGSMVYRRAGADWTPSLLPRVAVQPKVGEEASTARSTDLISRLAGIVNTTPGLHNADDAIVAQELDQALQNIRLRLNHSDQSLLIATGPAGGEYARFIDSLRPRGAQWAVSSATTPGSVANALMLDAGEARFGLVQSDVAAAAVTGRAAFAPYGPLRHVRAVTALFPEPVHVVVRKADQIDAIAALRGKRIAVGSLGSGTRQTAMQVLRAHGIRQGEYVPVDARDPGEALQLLAAGRIDAVIEVVSAPWAQLATTAVQAPLQLLPLDAAAVASLVESAAGLVPLTIPARTYEWQPVSVPTLAATALLLANAMVPAASVESVLDFLFTSDQAAARGASASRLSRERALIGVTIPLHDGAANYFALGGDLPVTRPPAVNAPSMDSEAPVSSEPSSP